jgi:hypothetical protein
MRKVKSCTSRQRKRLKSVLALRARAISIEHGIIARLTIYDRGDVTTTRLSARMQ